MYKLMLADDNPYLLEELCDIVDWEDFNFIITGMYNNGEELLEAAEKNVPDVVVTDIQMPVMNGIELAKNLKQLSEKIKIIFISSYADFELYHPKENSIVCTELKGLKLLVEPPFYLRVAFLSCSISGEKSDAPLSGCQAYLRNGSLDIGFGTGENHESTCLDMIEVMRCILGEFQEEPYKLILMPISAGKIAILIIYKQWDFDVADLLAQINVDIESVTGKRCVL